MSIALCFEMEVGNNFDPAEFVPFNITNKNPNHWRLQRVETWKVRMNGKQKVNAVLDVLNDAIEQGKNSVTLKDIATFLNIRIAHTRWFRCQIEGENVTIYPDSVYHTPGAPVEAYFDVKEWKSFLINNYRSKHV
jgi:hypothetical protein